MRSQGYEPTRGTWTDYSGTIAAANVSQTQIPANPNRLGIMIQNHDTANDLWINWTASATTGAGSIAVSPREAIFVQYGFISTEAINFISTKAGHVFTAKDAQ